jgi:hypothetical protein
MIEIANQQNWDKKIVFAPNATGKTTFCNKVYSQLKQNNINVEIMTARTVRELIELKREGIFIGKAAKNLGENDEIERQLESQKILNEIFNKYYVSSATELRKKSYTFAYYNITNDKISDFVKRIDFMHNDHIVNQSFTISFDKAFYLDQLLTKGDFELIDKFKNDGDIYNILKTSQDGKNMISKESFDYLNIIKNTIKFSETLCPLCGTNFDDNNSLVKSIGEHLSRYSISETKAIFDFVDSIWSKLLLNQNKLDLKEYNIILNEDFDYSQKLFELIKINDLFEEVRFTIIEWVNDKLKSKKIFEEIKKYKKNQEYIYAEKEKIKNIEEYYSSIIRDFKSLVNLPSELDINITKESTFLVRDLKNNKNLLPSECLSESEIKRLALAVLKNQIVYANVEYIIFDDPIDSYDDYFLKRASRYIAEIINDNINLKWTICSHVFEFVDILNKNINPSIVCSNIFYFYDPSHKYSEGKKPTLIFKEIPKEHISAITDHEIIIMKNIFLKRKEYEMSCDFALLSAVSTTRNFVKDIAPIYAMSYKNSKVNRNVNNMENRHIHYSNHHNYLMHELFSIYTKIYHKNEFKRSELISSNKESSLVREEILNSDYDSICVKNELLKVVLYNSIRVSYCKRKIEEKIINRMIKYQYPENMIKQIFSKNSLGTKLKNILEFEKKLKIKSNFSEIDSIYSEFNSIVNDFSHGTIRMFPPYLSINSFDISKFEKYIIEIE